MKTNILVFADSEIYADQIEDKISKSSQRYIVKRAYFLDDALEAVEKDVPDIIILRVKYRVNAICKLRSGGFKGFIIVDGPFDYYAMIAGYDINTYGVANTSVLAIDIAGKVQVLLNRPRKKRLALIKDLDHYVGMGLTRFETVLFLNKPTALLAMRVAKSNIKSIKGVKVST